MDLIELMERISIPAAFGVLFLAIIGLTGSDPASTSGASGCALPNRQSNPSAVVVRASRERPAAVEQAKGEYQ